MNMVQRLLAMSAVLALAGCASVKIMKVTNGQPTEGVPFYLPRPYVQVYEPFVVSSQAVLVSGRLSPDGQYLLVDNSKTDFNGALLANLNTDGQARIPVSQVRVQSPGSIGGPQAGTAPADAASAPAAAASAASAADAASGAAPAQRNGLFNFSVTQSATPFPTTLGRRFFDIVWMPDFDEKYVVQAHPGLGNADVGVTMVQGWGLYGLDARIDNSAIVKPLLDFYSTGLDALSKLAKSKILPASELGGPQAGSPDAQTLTPGSRVSIKITKVLVAAPGLYPVLKPSEAASVSETMREGSVGAKVLVPLRPYTNIAFNVYEVLVVEAAKATGDSPMNLQRFFDTDATGNRVPTPAVPPLPSADAAAAFDPKAFEQGTNKDLEAIKGTDNGFWKLSATAVDAGKLKANATLTGGKEKPATLATIEQLKAFLSKKSNGQFVSGKIELTEVK